MARGDYLGLEEVRKQKRLERFCKEHPPEGDKEGFERLSLLNTGLRNDLLADT